MRNFSKPPPKRTALVAILLGALTGISTLALAAPRPPSPVINSNPSKFTGSTTAGFAFSDRPGLTFVCSLDDGTYTPCGSPRNYSGLSSTTHTFAVEAVDATGHRSEPATYQWRVLTTPPKLTISAPSSGGTVDAARWAHECANAAGACGTAADPSGVTSVSVAIEQNETGRFWNGSSYAAATPAYSAAKLTPTGHGTGWLYRLPYPAGLGSYTVLARATNGVGLTTTTPASSTFTVDTIPAPVFTQTPPSTGSTTVSTFAWTDSRSGLSYQCSEDGGEFESCSTPDTFEVGAGPRRHTFSVEALDSRGSRSPATAYAWTVAAAGAGGFAISGSAPSFLYPGAPPTPLNLTLANPTHRRLTVTYLNVVVKSVAGPAVSNAKPCSVDDFTSTAFSGSITLPAGSSSLSQLGVPSSQWPTVGMRDTGVNQDGCQGATITLLYTGSAS